MKNFLRVVSVFIITVTLSVSTISNGAYAEERTVSKMGTRWSKHNLANGLKGFLGKSFLGGLDEAVANIDTAVDTLNATKANLSDVNNIVTPKPTVKWLSASSTGYTSGDTVLPTSGNTLGDRRYCEEDGHYYWWVSTGTDTYEWQDIGTSEKGYDELKEDLAEFGDALHSGMTYRMDNMVNPSSDNYAYLHVDDGIAYESTQWITTDYEIAKPNTTYSAYIISSRYRTTNPVWCAYDKNKQYISGQGTGTSYMYTTPPNTAYLRLSIVSTSINNVYVLEGDNGQTAPSDSYKPYCNLYEWKDFATKSEVETTYATKAEIEPLANSNYVVNSLGTITNMLTTGTTLANNKNLNYVGGEDLAVDLNDLDTNRVDFTISTTLPIGVYMVAFKVKVDTLDTANKTIFPMYLDNSLGGFYNASTYFNAEYSGHKISSYRSTDNSSSDATGIVEGEQYCMAMIYNCTAEGSHTIKFSLANASKVGEFIIKDVIMVNITNIFRADAFDLICNSDWFDSKEIKWNTETFGIGCLRRKTLYVIGDSITAGIGPTADTQNGGIKKTYGYLIAKRNGMYFKNFGMGGTTMSVLPNKTFCLAGTRYQNIPVEDADIVLIFMGYNDYYTTGYSLGTIDDTDTTTFYGAYNTVLNYYITNNAGVKFGLITPYGTDKAQRDAIKAIGQKYGVPVLDLYSLDVPMFYEKDSMTDKLTSISTKRKQLLLTDGTHPSDLGHEWLASIIEKFVCGL